MRFGDRLKLLIDEREITQKELAANLNIAPSTVSSYVQITREPDFETLKKIASFFEVTTDYLLDYQSDRNSSLQETEMLRVFRSLTNEQREVCIEQCKVFLKLNNREKASAKSS